MELNERIDLIEYEIKRPEFIASKGLGNEVNYRVFDYDPEDELYVRERIKTLINKINNQDSGFKIKEYDLYDLIIDELKSKGYLEKCFEFEKRSFDRITRAINNLMRTTERDNLFVNKIKQETEPNTIVFITGVGKCYPILRSHVILNNLHLSIDNVPVVLFFPGRYDGQKLKIFNEVKDDNYYRAFQLVER